MAAFVIAEVVVTDQEVFDEYRKQVPATVEACGGRYLVRGGAVERLEGEWEPQRFVMLEFDSVGQAKRWYDSEEYRKVRELRFRSAKSNLIIVEGV